MNWGWRPLSLCVVIIPPASMLSCGGQTSSNSPPTPSIGVSSLSLGSVTLEQGGGTQAVAVTLSRSNFTGSVTLSVSTLPTGVTANITQPGTGNSGSISLQAASNAALVNNQSITVTAGGTGVASATGSFSLTVNPPPSGGISEQVIVVGHTESFDFPSANAVQPSYSGTPDGFVTSIRLTISTTSQYTFSTFLGGSSSEQIRDLFLDAQGNVYVAGRTDSSNLPTTPGAFQPNYPGGPESGFVAKFSPSGQLLFLTHLGGSGPLSLRVKTRI
jgi:hypothetical protein